MIGDLFLSLDWKCEVDFEKLNWTNGSKQSDLGVERPGEV